MVTQWDIGMYMMGILYMLNGNFMEISWGYSGITMFGCGTL
jgi:hypothetical protein